MVDVDETLLATLLAAFAKAEVEEDYRIDRAVFKGDDVVRATRRAVSLWSRMQELNPTHPDQPPVGSCWRINTTIRPNEVVWYLYHD